MYDVRMSDSDAPQPSNTTRPSRRDALKVAGAAGLTALVLPASGASASVAPAGGANPTVPADGLLFNFDAGSLGAFSNGVWNDTSGNSRTGVLGAGVTYVAATSGTPAHFDFAGGASVGAHSAVITVQTGGVPSTQLLVDPNPGAYTKMVWFRRDADNRWDNLMSSGPNGQEAQHFLFFNSSVGNYQYVTAGNGSAYTRINSTLTVGAGAWTFAAVTFSPSTGFAVYSSQNDTSWTSTENIATSAYSAGTDALTGSYLGFQIGGYAGMSTFDGDIATAVAYSRALSQSDVKAYYDSTVSRFYP